MNEREEMAGASPFSLTLSLMASRAKSEGLPSLSSPFLPYLFLSPNLPFTSGRD